MSFVHKRKEKERTIIVLLRQTVCRTWFWFLVVKRILVNIMLSVLLRNTDSYYSFGIFKLFLYHGGQFYDTSSTRKTIDLPPVTAKLYHGISSSTPPHNWLALLSSYGSCIYNYLWNQCQTPRTLVILDDFGYAG